MVLNKRIKKSMKDEKKPTKEALLTRYWARLIKRAIKVVLLLFVLFLIVMGVIWAIPRVLSWALG